MVPQPDSAPKPRYAPEREFPPYAHVPGRTAHPREHPDGYLYGHSNPRAGWEPAERWRENRGYLYAVDLFNHGYFWGAQDLWESLWEASRRRDPEQALFLQGLIQLGAAFVQASRGRLGAVRTLGIGALGRFASVRERGGKSVYMGADLEALSAGLKEWLGSAEPAAGAAPPFLMELSGF